MTPTGDVEYVAAASRDDVTPGRTHMRVVAGREILLCNIGGDFYAVENRCSHLGKPLAGGRLIGTTLTCPFHSAPFDVRDGTAKGFPASRPIRCFATRVRGEVIEVAAGHN